VSQPNNILFLMTDQQRPDHAGFLPGSKIQTPNIDRLAGGVCFANCVTVNPICTPARTALLTGKYTHQIGTLAMSGDLSRQHPTYPRALQQAGYWTAGIGKFHWMQGWPWDTERGGGHDLAALGNEVRRYGFDYVWETAGKQLAQRNRCEHMAHLEKKGLLEAYRDHIYERGGNTDDALKVGFTGEPWPFDEEDYVDILTGDRIVECIRNRPEDRPFFIFGSFCCPHAPFDPPASYLERVPYEEDDDFITGDDVLPDDVKERLWRLRRAYRAMILLVDEQVGRIGQVLEEEGLLDDTVVLFTSDHGEMMGDHLRVQKNSWYRQSAVVPTAIRHPDHPDRSVNPSVIEITDLTATILDVAGLDPQEVLSKRWPAFHDRVPCRSLLPIVRGDADSVRDFAFSECNGAWQMIQSGRWKYVREPLRRGSPDEPVGEKLFDLESDPDELIDRAADPACAEVLAECRRRREWVMDGTPPAQTRWAPIGAEYADPKVELS
jgi:choline-sulfatase